MDLTAILNRLAEIDHDLVRLESERALAQSAAGQADIRRLQEEIDRLKKLKDELRAQFRRQQP